MACFFRPFLALRACVWRHKRARSAMVRERLPEHAGARCLAHIVRSHGRADPLHRRVSITGSGQIASRPPPSLPEIGRAA